MSTVLSQDYLQPKIGMVIDAGDPLGLGRVKAYIPGLFETYDSTKLPWISPLGTQTSNQYFSMLKGDKITVCQDANNPLTFYYQSKPDPSPKTQELIGDGLGTDILTNRVGDNGQQRVIMANESQGILLKNSGSTLNMTPQGGINISNSQGVGVNVSESSEVTIGDSTKEQEPSVLGNQLVDLLTKLKEDLNKLSAKCMSNWTTIQLSQPLLEMAQNLDNNISNILSSTVKITT